MRFQSSWWGHTLANSTLPWESPVKLISQSRHTFVIMVWPVFVQLQPQVFSLESILDNEEERSQRRRSRHPSTHFNKHRLSWIKLVIRGPVIYQLLRACETYTSEGRRKQQTSNGSNKRATWKHFWSQKKTSFVLSQLFAKQFCRVLCINKRNAKFVNTSFKDADLNSFTILLMTPIMFPKMKP